LYGEDDEKKGVQNIELDRSRNALLCQAWLLEERDWWDDALVNLQSDETIYIALKEMDTTDPKYRLGHPGQGAFNHTFKAWDTSRLGNSEQATLYEYRGKNTPFQVIGI